MAMGPTKPTPKPGMASKPRVAKPKPSKTPYVKSKTPGLQGGKTARIKADLQKAIKGGAAKAAKKLAPNDKVQERDYGSDYSTGRIGNTTTGIPLGYSKPKKYTSAKQKAKRNMIANNIINDKSKTAMRAKIVEMNAAKKRK
jgi:hypothetical protein